MRIKKKSSEFRGKNRCTVLREHESLQFESEKNTHYDNAVIVKEIIKGYFNGEFEMDEFEDLVSQGIGDEYTNSEEAKLREKRLVKCLIRLCKSETRTPIFPPKQVIEYGDYDVTVKPDALFDDGKTVELVIYRAGKPNVTMKGNKQDASVKTCIELYFLVLFGRLYVDSLPGNQTRYIRASYYFLRKNTDTKDSMWDSDFFSESGKNIVYLEDEAYLGKSKMKSDLDIDFAPQIDEFEKGRQCSGDDCTGCTFKVACQYQKNPEVFEKKSLSSKKGVITPSEAQQEIIDFRKGVCRVNATAGSGKTECMTERGARMFEEGAKPSEMLFITFTDAGAFEMKERLSKKCAARGLAISGDDIKAMTFNTFAYQIVKDKFEDVGFTKPPIVIDDVRNSVIVSQILEENHVAGLDYLNFLMNMPNCKGALACAIKVFDIIKSNEIDVKDVEASEKVKSILKDDGLYRFYSDGAISELCDLYTEYDKWLKEDNLMQFADQEPMMNTILDLYPDYLERYGFKHIIVDEFQDSNDVQLNTIKRLMNTSTFESLMVVGDDSQSIYAFRNTSQENILYFFEKLGVTDGKDLYLTENRRSTPEILVLANNINNLNVNKVDKEMISVRESGKKPVVKGFHDAKSEYEFIAKNIEKLIKEGTYQPEDIAFIAMKKSELVKMGSELSKLDIPWIMKNPIPLQENSRVAAAISVAEAFYQPEAAILYFNYIVAKHDGDIFSVDPAMIAAEVEALKQKFMSIDQLEISYQQVLFHEMLEAIKGTDEIYQYFLELVYANEDLQSELQYIHNFKKFGERVAKKMEQSYAGVVLTTAHSSKGLEWSVVFNSVSGFDAKRYHTGRNRIAEIEEKRRLMFVSMTRARDLLCVTGQYVAYGSKDDCTYNQFLKEVFDCAGEEYDPVDHVSDVKEIIRLAKRTKKSKTGAGEMTPEQIAEYEALVKNSEQVSFCFG